MPSFPSLKGTGAQGVRRLFICLVLILTVGNSEVARRRKISLRLPGNVVLKFVRSADAVHAGTIMQGTFGITYFRHTCI